MRDCNARNLRLIDGEAKCWECGGEPHEDAPPPVAEGAKIPGVVAGVCYLLLALGVALVVVGVVK